MSQILRLRKHLTEAQPRPVWPVGTGLLPLARAEPRALHDILSAAYANGFGTISPLAEWWPALIADSEFDPGLVIIAADSANRPIGLVQCWTSGFIKDVAVVPDWRGKSIGEALLRQAFCTFRGRGVKQVDLKVMLANAYAVALYERLGMVEVPL